MISFAMLYMISNAKIMKFQLPIASHTCSISPRGRPPEFLPVGGGYAWKAAIYGLTLTCTPGLVGPKVYGRQPEDIQRGL